ncbi:BTAD domain-containing putative transcriptional regulator [Tenuibacillus multivorans]|uniref:Tetratricopeptide repeat-containing protein n=1 Tax=Tenuibacillus multivorans TaxID=237069 RepID=A0A1H0G306_9BACI|nr:BTAD domain-containing putative transcriptional regulator [Tenuibacillus multivorans]GEL78106.1 transcriptional activator [Tenuibacillus multivorans]SDO01119.1 Tetratricopeptide repeat-containing protein [Tenuibacillus multivorans]
MSSQIPILESQFSPPAVKGQFVQRAALHKKLQLIPSYPVTFIYAGAGYGKSTGLSLFTQYSKYNVSWFSITEFDTDLLPFLTKLVYAIKKCYPHFGDRVLTQLEQIHHHVREREIWTCLTKLVNELEKINEEFIIVLDDAHHFMNTHVIEQWIQLFIEHLPEGIHFVLSSRQKPRWSVLSRLKVKGDLLEITQIDLELSEAEVTHLIQEVHGIELGEGSVQQIHQITEGWAIACGMFVHQLSSGEPKESLLNLEVQSLDDLFQYIEIEVLSKQPVIIQKFLEQTGVFELLTADACDQILRINSSSQMLDDLKYQSLFIQQIDDTHYRYHALFQRFLENRLKQTNREEYEHLHREAAYYLEQQNDLENAIHHWLIVRQFELAAQLLADHGQRMINEGRIVRLKQQLDKMPEKDKNHFPVLWFYSGEMLRYRAKYEDAEEHYNRAIALAEALEDYYVLSMAYEGKARIYLDTIRPDQADQFLRKAIRYREPLDVKDEEKARLYHMLGENLLNLGHAKKAEAWLNKAKALNLPIDDTNLEGRIYLRTGRLYQAKQFLKDKKEKFPNDESDLLPQSYRETDILLSIIESFMGYAEDGKKSAELGLQLGIGYDSAFVEACGWMRMGHAVQLLRRYDTDLAIKCYDNALSLMDQLNVSRLKAEPYMGLCMLYGINGEYEEAFHAGQMGLRETELVKDLWLSSIIRLCISIASVQCKRYDYAFEILEETREHFQACEDDYGLMLVAFWKAFLAFETKDSKTFYTEMEAFIKRLQTGSYEFFLKHRTYFGPVDLQLIAPLLYRAQEKGIYETYVTRMIHELGFGDLKKHPGYTLRLMTLGEFQILVGNEQVNDSDWTRAKSKELLELFITNRHTTMTKEEVFEQLWPEQDETGANKNFKVTLNGLLKILEPHRQAREESFFIQRSGSSYRLNPKSGYELDINLFEEFIQAGLDENEPDKSKELLLRGLKLYEGDYLANHRTVDWLLHERERLQVLFLRGAEKLAQVSVRLEDYHTCIRWCQEILYHDKTWEEAYRLLMYCYYQQNNRPHAIRWYKRLEDVLEKELSIQPMKTTQEMYEMVMEQV